VVGLVTVGSVTYWLVPEGSRSIRGTPAAESAPAWSEGGQTRLWSIGPEPALDSGPVDPRIEAIESPEGTSPRRSRTAVPEDAASRTNKGGPVAEFVGTIQATPQLRASHERDGPRIH
jgi:hypothetical protein